MKFVTFSLASGQLNERPLSGATRTGLNVAYGREAEWTKRAVNGLAALERLTRKADVAGVPHG
jgi:hypothetical protein